MLYILAHTLEEFRRVIDTCSITTVHDVFYVRDNTIEQSLRGTIKPVVLTLSCHTVGTDVRAMLQSRNGVLIPVYCAHYDVQLLGTVNMLRDRLDETTK